MADVVNRTTKVWLKSVNTPDFPETEWIINPDLSALANVPPKYWKIQGDLILEMSETEKMEVDDQELEEVKVKKIAEIDARTSELIKQGFFYNGYHFSMSEAAQRNWVGIAAAKANGLLQFPLTISTRDEGAYTISDAQECTYFLLAFMLYQVDPNQPLAQGRALKAQVKACTTVREVMSIVDPR